MIDPSVFNNVPFRNPTAWKDFVGTHYLWWRALNEQIFALTGTAIREYPIGDGGGAEWLQAVQAQYVDASAALGLSPPPDLSSYDLTKAPEYASWTFLVSQAATRLRAAAGLS